MVTHTPAGSTSVLFFQAGGLATVTGLYFTLHLSVTQALAIVAAVMFFVVGDQVSFSALACTMVLATSASHSLPYTCLAAV